MGCLSGLIEFECWLSFFFFAEGFSGLKDVQ